MGLIRLILALTIVLGHIYSIYGFDISKMFEFVGSAVAFQSFFIVSGFYTAFILTEKYTGENSSFKLFITNRFLRIYPLYWLILTLTIVVCLTTYFTMGDALILQPIFDLWDVLGFGSIFYGIFANIFIIGQDWVFFTGIDSSDGSIYLARNFLEAETQTHHLLLISQAWAISFIMMFYLVAPALVKRNWIWLVLIFAITQAARFYMFDQGFNHEPWKYRFFPFEFGMFIAGVLSYKIYHAIKELKIPSWTLWSIFLGMVILTSTLKMIEGNSMNKQWIYYGILIATMPFLFKFSKKSKIDRFLADISFPVFILHFLVIHFVGKVMGMTGNSLVLTVLGITFALSWIILRFYLMPIERIRQARVKSQNQES